MPSDHVLLKIDFKNAFNSCKGTRSSKSSFPELYHFISSAYRYPSYLICGDNIIKSEKGVQQGDPLALFYSAPCRATMSCLRLSSKMLSTVEKGQDPRSLCFQSCIILSGQHIDIRHTLSVVITSSSQRREFNKETLLALFYFVQFYIPWFNSFNLNCQSFTWTLLTISLSVLSSTRMMSFCP